MKNVLFGVIAAGVVYLVIQDYRKSKKKCGCKGASTAASASTGTTTSTPVNTSGGSELTPAIPGANLGADGFTQKVF